MKRLRYATVLLALSLSPSIAFAERTLTAPAPPAPASNDAAETLSDCLVNGATQDDKRALVRWIFAVIARHPDVSPMADIDKASEERIVRDAYKVFERLVTERCVNQIRVAVRESGTDAIGKSFEKLGEAAMDGLLSHPNVEAAIPELLKYADPKAFERALEQR